MRVIIHEEAGYAHAARGFARSYQTAPGRAEQIMPGFAGRQGESKFLRFLVVYLTLEDFPVHFWTQFETHRLGIWDIRHDDLEVQSESTMHTILRSPIVPEDFVQWDDDAVDRAYLAKLNRMRTDKQLIKVKDYLPSGYLQTRDLICNYAALRAIVGQREHHRNPGWGVLIEALRTGLKYPELIFKGVEK